MSTTEILELISLISYILSGISLLLAIFFWVKFRIPSVIGDLSGRTAKKSIERMRVTNEKSGKKVYRTSTTNLKRGKLTGTMPDSKELIDDGKGKEETELLQENNPVNISSQSYSGETDVLDERQETSLLVEEYEATVRDYEVSPKVPKNRNSLVMLDEVILVHTQDVIA